MRRILVFLSTSLTILALQTLPSMFHMGYQPEVPQNLGSKKELALRKQPKAVP